MIRWLRAIVHALRQDHAASPAATADAELLAKLKRIAAAERAATAAAQQPPLTAVAALRCEICRTYVEMFADQPLQLRRRAYRLIGSAPFVATAAGDVCAFHALFADAGPSPRQELD